MHADMCLVRTIDIFIDTIEICIDTIEIFIGMHTDICTVVCIDMRAALI